MEKELQKTYLPYHNLWIEYKCLCFNNYQHKLDEKLKERRFNTHKFSKYNNSKFIILLRKGVYPDEYMDDWEKFNET